MKRDDLANARKAYLLMAGAGLMFILAGLIPMVMALMRDLDLDALNAAFIAIGASFIAIAASTYAAAKKKAEDGEGGS